MIRLKNITRSIFYALGVLSLGSTYAKAADDTCFPAEAVLSQISQSGVDVYSIPPSTYRYETERAALIVKWALAHENLEPQSIETLKTTTVVDILGYPGKGWKAIFANGECAVGLLDLSPANANQIFDIVNGFVKVGT